MLAANFQQEFINLGIVYSMYTRNTKQDLPIYRSFLFLLTKYCCVCFGAFLEAHFEKSLVKVYKQESN